MSNSTTSNQKIFFSAYLTFFIVQSNQTGVGIAGVQRIIYLESRQDAWISIFISYVGMAIIVASICYILNTFQNKDLFEIHIALFGKWVGNIFNLLVVMYVFAGLLSIILNYTEIIQAWVFPDLETWAIVTILLLVTIYGVFGGIKTIVGVSFLGFFLTIWLGLMLVVPLRYIDWTNFFPIMEASIPELLRGAYKTSFTVLGVEILYFVYPYIREKKKVHFYSQMAVFFTFLLVLAVTFVAIGYYSGEQLEKTIWATLSMFKIIQFPNLERFEFLAVSIWLVIILPNTLFMLWAVSKGLKRVFKVRQKKLVIICSVILILSTAFFQKRIIINELVDNVGVFGFYMIFVYSILLAFIVFIRSLWKKRGEQG
ncbi:GerAB/ArcD/ProY family transporter [Sutcliffiella rhizosphaerae]|uniref:Spore germination protein YndE n=1 Tax=Sutcliffiella rhizosphaerae TaxID=2880967 RepID=A0ABN8A9Z2_9BACI|nr:GerAB/ArcD/ProY family transporter [Sutcliffiella rhizosphaerae]CAG9621995.1 Spore germination protein YndE [Sutcliffiella rhizosphaerae]